jgi:hypothetical protein
MVSHRLLDRSGGRLLITQYLMVSNQQVAHIPYSQFQPLLQNQKVAQIGVSNQYR